MVVKGGSGPWTNRYRITELIDIARLLEDQSGL